MASLVGAILFLHPFTLPIFHSPFPTSHFPLPIFHFPGCYPMLPHCLPCRVSRGAATFPHRLPLRSIPPPRFACGSSHSRGHGRPRSVRKSSRLRWKCLSMDCICSDRRKSFGPSAPIAYATSVSPPNEAVAWPCSPFLQFTARANPCSRHLWGTLARSVASICAHRAQL